MSQPNTNQPKTNQRRTKQRDAIERAFTEAARPLSTVEVHQLAQRHVPGLGIATVYRAVRGMEQDRFLETVPIPGQPDRYELAGLDHHHHFCCRSCDRVFDVEGCNVADASPEGFEVEAHEVLLYGQCDRCAV